MISATLTGDVASRDFNEDLDIGREEIWKWLVISSGGQNI